MGVVRRRDDDPTRDTSRPVGAGGVELELNRFHAALLATRAQLTELRARLTEKLPEPEVRILDVHAAYLRDSAFIADVERLIQEEHLALESAIGKVIADFDRIFRLVQNDALRERAADLRDVGTRVLRNLTDPKQADGQAPGEFVLAVRELGVVDLFDAQGRGVLALLAERGGSASHAAILARSVRVPTLSDLPGLLEAVADGDFVIVDASEGTLRIHPPEHVRAQYAEAMREAELESLREDLPPAMVREPRSLDGERLHVSASCGSLAEVEQASALAVRAIELYRTEFFYLVAKQEPDVEALERHYAGVVAAAGDAPITFRLLHVDSGQGPTWLYPARERNPALGITGVRALLAYEGVLRRQLQALLTTSSPTALKLAVPFVTDVSELRRVKEILFEERRELVRAGKPVRKTVELGAVLEVPSAFLGAKDLAAESDFLLLGLDSMVQNLLAADRDNAATAGWFESLHPYVLRALRRVVRACRSASRPLTVFGSSLGEPAVLPFVLGCGVRHLAVPPANLREVLQRIGRLDLRLARRQARSLASATCVAETISLLKAYREGY